MKTEINTIAGFDMEIGNMPETLAELVSAVGSEQDVLDLAIKFKIYHEHNTEAREKVVAFLEEKTGVKRQTKEVNGKTVVDESHNRFVSRLRAELGDEAVDGFASQIRHLCPTVDWTPSVRGTGAGSKVAAKWLAAVDQLIEAGKLERFAAKHDIDISTEEEVWKKVVALKLKSLIEAQQAAILAAATNV
jgi:hypothetical protein